MQPYPSVQFGFIDDPDRQFGNGSVWTRTQTRSDGPEPLLTLVLSGHSLYHCLEMSFRSSVSPNTNEKLASRHLGTLHAPDTPREVYLST